MPAQAPRIRIAHMVDPTLYAGIQLCKRDLPLLVGGDVALKTLCEFDDIARFQAAVRRVDDEAQPGNPHLYGYHLRGGLMHRQA